MHCRNPLRGQRGQSLIEYVILVALVGVATMGMVRLLQSAVKVNLANVVASLQGGRSVRARHAERMDESALKKMDFSNFMSGARGQGRGGDDE